jgi:hypothetical protein
MTFYHLLRLCCADLLFMVNRNHRKTRANIHALSGIRTHDSRNQPVKTHASDRTATVIGVQRFCNLKVSTGPKRFTKCSK